MALINCSECGKGVSEFAAACPGCGRPLTAAKAFPASDKERFDLGVTMLKDYYAAIEARLASSLALFVVIIGWLIASKDTRRALAAQPWFVILALVTLTLVLSMYGWNIAHWLRRWRNIRDTVDGLHYMEPRFYTRYELPRGTWVAYFTPIALLYVFIAVFLILIARGWFAGE
jgi:hypothetical protein